MSRRPVPAASEADGSGSALDAVSDVPAGRDVVGSSAADDLLPEQPAGVTATDGHSFSLAQFPLDTGTVVAGAESAGASSVSVLKMPAPSVSSAATPSPA
jgi:hypothetical protein